MKSNKKYVSIDLALYKMHNEYVENSEIYLFTDVYKNGKLRLHSTGLCDRMNVT